MSTSTLHRPIRALAHRAAFTLTELLVAVGVLVVVIVAAAKIFSASSKVAGVTAASADLLQTAAAIEAQVRADIANLPPNAFMVIQQVEVNPAGTSQTIDPALGRAEIRADQLAFFTRGYRTTTQYTGSQESSVSFDTATTWTAESAIARVYYGHGVLASTVPVGFDPTVYGAPFAGEPNYEGAPIVPWQGGRVETRQWGASGAGGLSTARLPVTKASNWPLARHATLMATDGAASGVFASTTTNATNRLFADRAVALGPLGAGPLPANVPDPLWTSSRVDVVKWQPDDLFSQTAYQYNATLTGASSLPFISSSTAPWGGPSIRLRMLQTVSPWAVPATRSTPANGATALFVGYPRVEKASLGPARAEQMLTAPVLAPNCSSFKVEWTWPDGVGRDTTQGYDADQDGTLEPNETFVGVIAPRSGVTSWFGLDDAAAGAANSAVRPMLNGVLFPTVAVPLSAPVEAAIDARGAVGQPLVFLDNNLRPVSAVEGPLNPGGDATVQNKPIWKTSGLQGGKRVYQAVFGLNQSDSTIFNPGAPARGPYTPLPSAIRITVRLHDPLGRIEGGRDFQFIVDLPKR